MPGPPRRRASAEQRRLLSEAVPTGDVSSSSRSAAAPLALLVPLPLKIVVDSVLGSHRLPNLLDELLPSAATRSSTRILVTAAVLQVIFVAAVNLQVTATYVLRTYVGENLTLRFRARLFRHVQRLSLAFHDRRGTSDSLYRVQYDGSSIQWIVAYGVMQLVSAAATLLALLYVTARTDWQLALVTLLVCPPLAILNRNYNRRMRSRYKDAHQFESVAMSVVQEVLSAFRVVSAFGREEQEQDRFVRRSSRFARQQIRLSLSESLFGLAVNTVTAAGTAVVLYLGVRHVQSHTITLGDLLLVMASGPVVRPGSRRRRTAVMVAPAQQGEVHVYDRRQAWAEWECHDMAGWLSWKCGVSPVTAREQVRVARALFDLPLLRRRFGEGRLSYSQVRAISRVATASTEDYLVELASMCTAAQLERITRGYRKAREAPADTERRRDVLRYLRYHYDEEGNLVDSFRLPAESGALIAAAVSAQAGRDAVKDADSEGAADPFAAAQADALVELVRLGAEAASAGAPGGEDRAYLVTVIAEASVLGAEMPAEATEAAAGSFEDRLAATEASGPAQGGEPAEAAAPAGGESPLAGQDRRERGVCQVAEGPGLASSTARRIACDSERVAKVELGRERATVRLSSTCFSMPTD